MAHIHILGICGTFMGGLARIAVTLGHQVSGSDANTYPPMSTQLEQMGVKLYEGYSADNLHPAPDLVIIGNAMSRGNACVEYVLDKGLHYCSGPQWLSENALQDKWVLAISGTHGKTTTSSMLAWILEYNGYQPGYLIGGVCGNFEHSAQSSDSPFFVIEADEYDSAFFDKRSKMIHYRPKTYVINNLEFDHADIFDDLKAIQTQFHHCVRTVPSIGRIIYPKNNQNVQRVIEQGCWSEQETFAEAKTQPNTISNQTDCVHWQWKKRLDDGSEFEVFDANKNLVAEVNWQMIGDHNVNNAMAAIAAARHVGVLPEHSAEALNHFKGVKRRMELRAEIQGIKIYDDFAHHPTAIKTTLLGLRKKVGEQNIIAVLDPRSNTMRMGVHKDTLMKSLEDADSIFLHQPKSIKWQIELSSSKGQIMDSVEHIIEALLSSLKAGDNVVIMSNGGFDDIHQRLISALQNSHSEVAKAIDKKVEQHG